MSVFTANVVNENGEQFIPSTQRPDGTWRKARRVKDGYVPQEEVPLYESKGKQIMSKKNEPIILPSGHVGHKSIPGLFILPDETEKKPTKKKSKKKLEDVNDHLDNLKITETPKTEENKPKKTPENAAQGQKNSKKPTETTDPEKKLKNLKKRLREVEALEEKIKNGSLAKPEPEQLAKIKRKNDLLLQIHELERQIQQGL